MKSIIKMFIVVVSMIVMGSCEKDQSDVDIQSCNLSNLVKDVSDLEGTVWFNSSTNSYAIYVSIPGSYDSQDVGIVCNLPEKYQVDGLKIVFNGKYFIYEKDVLLTPSGQTYYYLELSNIRSKN